MRGKLYFAWTFRPLLRILTTVKNKLVDKIAKKMGPQYRKSIEAALEGKEFDEKIKQMMERKSLDLMDDNKQLIFRQVTGGNEQALKAREDSDDDILDEDEVEEIKDQADIRIHSPNALQLQKAQISGNEEEIANLEQDVIKFVKQNSNI